MFMSIVCTSYGMVIEIPQLLRCFSMLAFASTPSLVGEMEVYEALELPVDGFLCVDCDVAVLANNAIHQSEDSYYPSS